MEAALRRLLLLRLRGGARHRWRQLASPTGLVAFAALAAALWLVFGTDSSLSADGASRGDSSALREDIADFMPIGLLAVILSTVVFTNGSPLHFSATEVNFLFAGPFSRRGLVTYKFCVYLFGATVNAAIIALLLPPRASSGLAAFAGSALTLLFVQMASTAITMCTLVLDSGRISRWRRPAVLLVVAGAGVWAWHTSVVSDESVFGVLRQFRHSWLGELLLAPFVVFTRILLARELIPELLGWACIGIVINVALLQAIVALDRRSFERSLEQSNLASKRWQRILSSGALWASQKTSGRSLVRAPALWGIGPIVWRQAINAYRNCGRVILVLMSIAAVAGPILAHTTSAHEASARIAMVYLFATFVLPKALVLDFRAELDSIELYKSLPASAWRISVGQVVVAMLVSSAIELVLIAGAWLFLEAGAARLLAIAALFVLPFNLVVYALENLVFLLLPARPVPVGRVDFEFMGRTVVEYFGKSVIIIAAVAISGGLAVKVLAATGQHWLASVLVGWLTLGAIGLALVGLCALAFRRFQVSDTMT